MELCLNRALSLLLFEIDAAAEFGIKISFVSLHFAVCFLQLILLILNERLFLFSQTVDVSLCLLLVYSDEALPEEKFELFTH